MLPRISRRWVHVGVLQVFKLQPVPTPRGGEQLKMLFPSGVPESADESAAALAAAADRGEPFLVTVSALRTLLHEPHAALSQLANGDGQPALLGGADAGVGAEAEGESPVALTAAAADALMTQDSLPLADVLAAGAGDPDWSRTVAPERVAPPLPTGLQRSLMRAASAGDVEELSWLIAEAPAQAVRDASLPPSGGSALHFAAASGSSQAVEALLSAGGCSVHARAANGATPLHWAAGGGHAGAVRALLRAGADPRARSSTWRSTVRGDASGQTAAHWAAAGGHAVALEELIAADPYTLALTDERALSLAAAAARDGHRGLEAALTALQTQPVVCVRVRREMTLQRPLHHAAPQGE
jgi:hypothetical protein